MSRFLPSTTLAKFDIQRRLSTDDLLIHDNAATYFSRAKCDPMVDAGIFDGNVMIVGATAELLLEWLQSTQSLRTGSY